MIIKSRKRKHLDYLFKRLSQLNEEILTETFLLEREKDRSKQYGIIRTIKRKVSMYKKYQTRFKLINL
jgi:membrane-bound lytic murein transglycosylase MltF